MLWRVHCSEQSRMLDSHSFLLVSSSVELSLFAVAWTWFAVLEKVVPF